LLGALALFASDALGAPAVGPAVAPGARPSAPGIASSQAASALLSLVTRQSIYLPCYAFVPLAGAVDHWDPGRTSCFTMRKNEQISLAAPLHLPVTSGKLRIDKLKCYAYSGTAGDRIEYTAGVMSGNTTLARIEAVQNRDDDAEDVASGNDVIELDPTKQHYDVTIVWNVEVADGDGWLPKDNEFRGCRVDYSVFGG
jgi:hypothetical protein